MALKDVTEEFVLKAITEFDKLGEEEFLAEYRYGPATEYLLVHQENLYPSKAIIAVAHYLQFGKKDDYAYGGVGSGAAADVAKKLGFAIVKISSFGDTQTKFDSDVEKSSKDTQEARDARLATASTKPKKIARIVYLYGRNPDVVATVLERANGYCENCKQPAPFLKKRDGQPYLEVHHKIKLADGGGDTVANAIALCPNCHRKAHYG